MQEELRTVSRMVAVGSDIIDQNRKTVSQLQVTLLSIRYPTSALIICFDTQGILMSCLHGVHIVRDDIFR